MSYVGKSVDVDVSSQKLVDTGGQNVDVGVGASKDSDKSDKRIVDVSCEKNADDVPSKSSEVLKKKRKLIVDDDDVQEIFVDESILPLASSFSIDDFMRISKKRVSKSKFERIRLRHAYKNIYYDVDDKEEDDAKEDKSDVPLSKKKVQPKRSCTVAKSDKSQKSVDKDAVNLDDIDLDLEQEFQRALVVYSQEISSKDVVSSQSDALVGDAMKDSKRQKRVMRSSKMKLLTQSSSQSSAM